MKKARQMECNSGGFQETLRELLEKRKTSLEKLVERKTRALKKAPEGTLRCTKSLGYIRYYRVTPESGANGKYINKSDFRLACALAQKEYDQKVLSIAKRELRSVRTLLRTQQRGTAEMVFLNLSDARRNLVKPDYLPDKDYKEQWQCRPYEHKPFHEDAPDFYTQKGERVRSKSEILIADTLNRYGVPYRYEYPLDLPGFGVIHPDFMVLTADRSELFWEHLGMMDDPDYAASALKRIELYERNGYYPGKHLIITHETSARPLGTKMIEAVIRNYFL